jgi:predicted DNA-binding transcriptional regulator AlpA
MTDLPFDLARNRVISIRKVSEMLGISQSTLRKHCATGDGPKIIRLSSRRVGVRVKDLDSWLALQAADAPNARKH